MANKVDPTVVTEIKKAVQEILLEKATEAETKAFRYCPKVTGKLARTIQIETHDDGFSLKAGGAAAPYAPYVEYGTVPMERAHGKHEPESPVKDWEAKRKRYKKLGKKPKKLIAEAQAAQRMPFLRPSVYEVMAGG